MSHYKPDPNKSVSLTIDGRPVTVPEGTRILEAALKAGVRIPTLCDHPDLGKRSVCRLCVVECDGRGKLLAACANDVSEGMNIVTNNARILNIRRTIVELLLANHPQDCLTCVRSKNCELQTLAADFGIRETPFRRDAKERITPVIEGAAFVRDMVKCVKCGRCVEVCQESETIRAINTSHRGLHYEINAPYALALADGPCTFCGHCVEVCPVGALYEYDQTAEVWAALGDKQRTAAVQIAPALCETLGAELGLTAGAISPGKMVSALKLMGFDRVFDARDTARLAAAEIGGELLNRIKDGGQSTASLAKTTSRLPMITGCAPGWINFAKTWRDLSDHFYIGESPRSIFARTVRELYSREGIDPSSICAVTITPCIAGKFNAPKTEPKDAPALTVRELARMIRLAGIGIAGLQETPFDIFDDGTPNDKATVQGCIPQTQQRWGITETELNVRETTVKALIVSGFANARTVLDSVSKGECNTDFVEIIGCSGEGNHASCQIYTNFPTNVLN